MWTNDDINPGGSAIPLTSHQHHFSSSSTGGPIPPYTSSGNGLTPSLFLDHQRLSPLFTGTLHQDDYSSGGGVGTNSLRDYRERIYNPKPAGSTGMSSTDEEFKRGSSARTSKYKAKMEKARRDFLHQDVGTHNGINMN